MFPLSVLFSKKEAYILFFRNSDRAKDTVECMGLTLSQASMSFLGGKLLAPSW